MFGRYNKMDEFVFENVDIEELAFMVEYEQYLLAMKYERMEDGLEL